jgi:hypothetical protein
MSANRRDIVIGLGSGTALMMGAQHAGASDTGAAPAALSAASFGARGDGSGDQAEPMQRAITEAGARGVPLVIPGGVYRIGQTLTLPPRLHIVAAPGAALIGDHARDVLNAPDNDLAIIEGLELSSTGLLPDRHLLACRGGELILNRCRFSAAAGGGLMASATRLGVRDCTAYGLGGVAFAGHDGAHARISENVIEACASGIELRAAGSAIVTANRISRFAGTAIQMRDIGMSANLSANLIEDCATGIGLSAGRGISARLFVHDNMIDKAAMGITVDLEQDTHAVIATNIITRTRAGAIRGLHNGRATSNDLAIESAEAFLNLSIFGNLTR